jgi:hypothetical protein
MVVITTNGGLQPWAIQGSLLRALKDVPAVSHSRGEIAGAVSFLGLGTANIRRLQFQIRGERRGKGRLDVTGGGINLWKIYGAAGAFRETRTRGQRSVGLRPRFAPACGGRFLRYREMPIRTHDRGESVSALYGSPFDEPDTHRFW